MAGEADGRRRSGRGDSGPAPAAAAAPPKKGASAKKAAASTPAKAEPEPAEPAGPRRTGRERTTVLPAAPAPDSDEKAAAPRRDRGGAPLRARGPRAPRASRAAGAPSRLRKRGSVSFREPDDSDSDLRGSDERRPASSDSEDSVVDEAVYVPPPEARLPDEVELRAADGAAGGGVEGADAGAEGGGSPAGALAAGAPARPRVAAPADALGDMLAAYATLRAFSWQLRLSPFPFEDLAAALAAPAPSTLADEVHVCVLRALAADETPKERADRRLDLGLLDALTWPAFVWEYLTLTFDPLAKHQWTSRPPRGGGAARRAACEPADEAAVDAALAAGAAAPSAAALFAGRHPAGPGAAPEYAALPTGVKAAILARLCDALLECPTVLAEVERRLGGDELVTGAGGEGGRFAVMTPEEKRRAEAAAARRQQSDANADVCVLCGLGGNLLCCDSCPAAYHMRCLGETSKSLGDGDWHCPECAAGGRGEAAGVRLPAAARNRWRQPHFLLGGAVVRAEAPAIRSRGKHAEEVEGPARMAYYPPGAAAAEALAAATRVRTADELPLPSSYEAVRAPPAWPEEVAAAGPEGYANKYKNAWGAAVAALRATADDARRRKHKGGLWVPTGTCGHLGVAELPEPLPLSRFAWGQLQGRPLRASTRCGRCPPCLRPSLRKGCLNPAVRADDGAGAGGEAAEAEASKLPFLIALTAKAEREFWALAEGPWAAVDGSGMQFRNAWSAAVRGAGSASDLATALLQLEAALRPVALDPAWHGVSVPAAAAAEGVKAEGGDAGAGPSEGAAAAAYAARAAADPYDIRSEKVVKGGWEVDRRSHAARAALVNRLPAALVHRAARAAGRRPIPGLRWRRAPGREARWSLGGARLAWVAEVEAATTAPQLALALRRLEAALAWEDAGRPRGEGESPFAHAQVRGRRPLAGGRPGEYEYLVDARPAGPSVADAAAALAARQAAAAGRAAASTALQQQLLAAHRLQCAAAAAAGQPPPPPPAFPAPPVGWTPPGAGLPPRGGSFAGGAPFSGGPSRLGVAALPPAVRNQMKAQRLGPAGCWRSATCSKTHGHVGHCDRKASPAPGGGAAPPSAAGGSQAGGGSGQATPGGAGASRPETVEGTAAPETGPATAAGSDDEGAGADAPARAMPAPGSAPPGSAPPAPGSALGEDDRAVGPGGRTLRRCGQCYNCLHPGHKQSCGMLAAAREERAIAAAAADLARALEARAAAEAAAHAEPDPAALARAIVGGAVAKALRAEAEAERAALAAGDAPAAMAAKLRGRRASLGDAGAGGSSGDLALEAAGALADAPAAPAPGRPVLPGVPLPLPAGLPAALAPALAAALAAARPPGVFAAAPAPGAAAAGGAVWMHERELPLWLIRAYEEGARREAANKAARAAAAAARGRAMLHQDAAARDAARAAARDAAAAAADACGLCGGAQGEDAELDDLWISCDACQRWFHGGCVAMKRADVEEMGEGEEWNCPGCWNARRKAERAARRREREGDPTPVAPPFGGPFGPPGAAAAAWADGGEDDGSTRRGRPAKPFFERADYKAGEQKALERWQKMREAGGGKKRRLGRDEEEETEEERAAREARRAERLAKKRAAQEEAAAEAQLPVECPVCARPDFGRPLVACDACARRFHFDCTGLVAEDIEAAVAEGRAVRCAECSGKRVRPPSEFAIRAAIDAAAARAEAERGGPARGTKRARGASPEPATPAAPRAPAPRVNAANWRPAAIRALARAMRAPAAAAFLRPVEPEEAPDYYEVIARPMDLGTLRDTLETAPTPVEIFEGVALVAANCEQYNGPDAALTAAARAVEGTFRRAWRAEGLPASPEEWATILEGRHASGGGGAPPAKRARPEPPPPPPTRPLAPLPGHAPAPDWPARAGAALRALAAEDVAFPFLEPVPLDVPGYHEEISSPMDLSTVQLRLQNGQYADPSRMAADLALIWANCRAFNRPDAPVVGAAAAAEAALAREWAAVGVWRAAPPPADWPAAAAGVLRALVESVPAAAWFAQPPTAADAPGYHDALAHAGVPHVDLGAITTRLAEGGYAGPAALAADAAAAWAAAEAGHGAGHALASAAAAMRDAFDRLWAAACLPPAPAAGPGWEEAARRVLDGVAALPEAALFLRPVTEEDVEGYFDVIKAPMDLGTVRRRLLRKQYGAPAEALADARLVWSNCHVFNDVEDEVYAWGVRCEAALEAAWTAAGLPGGGGSVMRDD
jgi:hypothetical protein